MLMRPPENLESTNGYGAIKKKIDSDYTANQSIWQIYWTEATIDTRLEAGDTSLMAEINTNLPNNNRGSYYFNRVRPMCGMVSGHQRTHRKSTIVVPLENADQKTADQWSKILLGIYKREGVYETISDAFHQGACITGMNLLHVYMDYASDPVNGNIKVDNLAYNQFFIDPYFRKTDLSDCNFVWRRSYLSHSAAASLIPDRFEDIMNLPGNPTGTGRDGRFQYMPESYGQTQQNRLAYDEYYYRDYRLQRLLIDEVTGETMEITTQDKDDVKRFLADNPEVMLDEQWIPTVRLAIMIQDQVFYDGPSGMDVYPFVPVIGYYNPMMPYFYSRIQGICRSLRDPQLLYNRRVILSADAAESVVNTGWKFKENAVVDVKHLFQTGQGRVIPIKEEAAMSDVEQLVPQAIPQYFFQLQDTFSKEMNLVSGVNEEMLGQNFDDKSGFRSALQQSAGIITLKPLFDRLDNSQNILGNLIMTMVRLKYTPGKIRNLLEGDEPAPLFYNKAFGKYHCTVELGLNTETQKQMAFYQRIQLRQMGVPITDEDMIEYATFQNKDKTLERMQASQQQQQQMQMVQMQSQIQEQQARAELAKSRAMADRGLAHERDSRVYENYALAEERKAEAAKDDQQALLNYVKALKEIESIDYVTLEKIISIQQMLKQHEMMQRDQRNPRPVQSGSEAVR